MLRCFVVLFRGYDTEKEQWLGSVGVYVNHLQ